MAKGKEVILVTGATGQQGGAVARQLAARKHTVRAMTRKPDGDAARALARQGVEVVKGDLNDADSLRRALQGAWGVFAVQNTWEAGVEGEEAQGKRIAELARKAGVQHYVYTSVGSAHRTTGIPHFDNKWRVEETIRGLGFPSHVILRPVFFMDNFLSPWFKPGIDQGKLMIALKPTTVVQMIAVKDIGMYGLLAFERAEELNRKEIDLAGDGHTMPQTAQLLSKAAARTITFQPVPMEEVRKASEDYAIMLEWFDRVGYNVDIPGNARRYGVKPTTLAEWAASVKW
jgi:uncharacterized protein YbjT (DUF2867 family)